MIAFRKKTQMAHQEMTAGDYKIKINYEKPWLGRGRETSSSLHYPSPFRPAVHSHKRKKETEDRSSSVENH